MDTTPWQQELFADVLACEEIRPAGYLPGDVDAAAVQSAAARGEALLRALAVVEDGRGEESDEHGATHLAIARIEARLDLLTAMVATLARSAQDDPARELHWSARGVRLRMPEAVPAGSRGRFRVQPADWLPEPLLIPATVLACIEAGGEYDLWLRFGPFGPALEAALERHLFRQHRKAVAGQRRPR